DATGRRVRVSRRERMSEVQKQMPQGQTEADARDAMRSRRKTRVGTVVSDKMQKTVVVAIERRVPHPVYGKMITRTKRIKAHDEENSAKVGDTVRIVETRPLSKDKRWRVVEIVDRAR